jgi:ubiquinone/menaquinone biosynthesis C-methylase UbiE
MSYTTNITTHRKPLQGVWNIIRFNWHFYFIATLLLVILVVIATQLSHTNFAKWQPYVFAMFFCATLPLIISLLVSFYVYDVSELYSFSWLDKFITSNPEKILTINAGFDETSPIIQAKLNKAALTLCDFYNPQKHTEVSIKRARKAYPPNPQTIVVETTNLPFETQSFDKIFAVLSAHEIRNEAERVIFFAELRRITKPDGYIFVTEHLRDFNNFLAYTIGFLHFYSHKSWLQTFENAGLTVQQEIKITPFISTFVVKTNKKPKLCST